MFELWCPGCSQVVVRIHEDKANEGVIVNRPEILDIGCPEKTHLRCVKAEFERRD